jgi:hypothetical protein
MQSSRPTPPAQTLFGPDGRARDGVGACNVWARTEQALGDIEVARWADALGVPTERNFVTFRTGLFRDEQPDDELDRWFLGEDCANWLHSKLLAVEGVSPGVKPLEEDWGGWTFKVRVHGVSFWLNIWPGLQERKTWIIRIEPSPGQLGVFRRQRTRLAKAKLCDAIDSALASTPEITSWRWLDKHPEG